MKLPDSPEGWERLLDICFAGLIAFAILSAAFG